MVCFELRVNGFNLKVWFFRLKLKIHNFKINEISAAVLLSTIGTNFPSSSQGHGKNVWYWR